MPLYAGASFGLSFAAFLKSLSDFSYSPRAFAVALSASLPFLAAASSSSFLPFRRWSSPLLYASIARSSGDIDGNPDAPPPEGAGADEPFANIPTCTRPTAAAINTDVLNMRRILVLLSVPRFPVSRFPVSGPSGQQPAASSHEDSLIPRQLDIQRDRNLVADHGAAGFQHAVVDNIEI